MLLTEEDGRDEQVAVLLTERDGRDVAMVTKKRRPCCQRRGTGEVDKW